MPSHEPNPFPHTDEPDPNHSLVRFRIEAGPEIRNGQFDFIAAARKVNHRFRSPAVLDNVSQGFLHNSKEAECYIL
jgi:hypothetical protein